MIRCDQFVGCIDHIAARAGVTNADFNRRVRIRIQQRGERGQLGFAVKAVPVQPVKQIRAVPQRFGACRAPAVFKVLTAHIAAQIQALRLAHGDFQHGSVRAAQCAQIRKIALRKSGFRGYAEATGIDARLRGIMQIMEPCKAILRRGDADYGKRQRERQ